MSMHLEPRTRLFVCNSMASGDLLAHRVCTDGYEGWEEKADSYHYMMGQQFQGKVI